MKPLYEVFDDFEKCKNKKERMKVIEKNLSQTLVDVLNLTFNPIFKWKIKDLPDNYTLPTDVLPGLTFDSLHHQLRKLYMFREGDETAEKLEPKKQQELLFQMLNALEPREAEIIIGIFRKNQGVKGLDYKFVKEAFPQMLP